MKKILFAAAVAVACVGAVRAAEAGENDETTVETEVVDAPQKQVGVWPAFFAIGEIPSTNVAPDVIGLRLTIPYSTKHENVTGFDLGLWGRAQYFEGFMFNILRNDVRDELSGVQVGLYNSAGQSDMLGIQVGLWNEAGSNRGIQAGLVNTAGIAQGVQVGLINRAEEMYGFQVGVINVIRDAELTFCPLVNVGF